MDINGDGRKEQVEESWIPKTPFKPILPNPRIIYTDERGYPVDQEQLDRSGSTGYGSNLYPGAAFETWSACPNSNWEIALQTKVGTSEELWPDVFDGSKMNFMSLLALQDQASAAAVYRNGDYRLESSGLWCDNFRQNAINGIATSHGPAPDLNLPPVGTAESISHRTTIQMAPVTPEKTPRAEITFALDQGSQNTAAEVNSRPETCTELQEVGKNSSGAVSAVVNENGNDVGGLETPQQKPKRRKHRPKVITEGKPRVRKPATPKPATPAENQTGKRKYVRKKPLEKTPATTTPTEPKDGSTPPTECKGISTPQGECEGSSAGKRKYVRKKLINEEATPVVEPTDEPTLAQTAKPANYSCRRSLNFDADVDTECRPNSDGGSQLLPEDVGEWCKSKLTVNFGRGIEVMVEPTCDLSRSIDQMRQKYNSLPDQRMPNAPLAAINSLPEKRAPNEPLAAVNSLPERRALEEPLATLNSLPERGAPTVPYSAMNSLPERAPNAPVAAMNFLPEKRALEELFAPLSQAQKRKRNGREVRGNQVTAHYAHLQPRGIHASNWLNRTEWEKCNFDKQQDSCSTNITGICYNSVSAYEAVKRQNSTASSISCVTYLTSSKETIKLETIGVHRNKMQPSSSILTQVEGPTRKRSRTPTRGRDVDSLTKIVRGRMSYNVHQVTDLNISYACNEVQAAAIDKQLTTKKRSKERVSLVNYQPSSSNVQSHGKIMLHNRNQYSPMLLGTSPADIWMSPIIQQLQQLDINRETSAIAYNEHNALVPYSYSTTNEQNALVLYGRDGTVVPFQPIRRRKTRAKVDLDEETGKVWRLLLDNINSEGIDGTDEEKAKWWKEEREVFSGRANSFIARMHLVQGDRRFTPWKGSVVDSVVGVFLTQNVSDHLSSSAFMSMAANFPLKSTSHEAMRDSTSEEPIVCIPDLEDSINDVSNPSTVNQSPVILHVSEPDEEREADYSNESSMSSTGIIHSTNGVEGYNDSVEKRSTTDVSKIIGSCHLEGNRSIANDSVSSQNSVVSSQNSTDSPFAQTSDRNEFFSDHNAEADQVDRVEHNCLNSSNTFTELLMKAGRNELHDFPSNSKGTFLSPHNSFLFGKIQNVDSEKKCSIDCTKSSLERSSTSESAHQITDGNNVNNPTHEASKYTATDDPLRSIQDMQLAMHSQVGVAKDLNIVEKSETQAENELQQNVILPNLSGKDQDIVESSGAFTILEKDSQKTPESRLAVDGFQETKELAAKRKAKGRRVGGEIRDDVDWDALKKEAESIGRKRERMPDTMDSVDWEAVRCADVSKIADTIKERGMNNVLAGRIKDFLNRLVREHGSIDLEWLRDVPPDKAKEYLLTFRGLGLKSVECIRLLTLHHLAFPVDTNVARIAVRLGWVPLQPLPESLQLHLLELYPIQESIQKYLWPRLCKLNQKTLYELHYQLITFGKVFCTKSKPNCNACPMRGECRHFASAFASARLSLPGPEEKSIVSAAENRKNEPNPTVMVDQLQLSLPQMIEKSEEHQHSELKQLSEVRGEVKKCEPIVEEPSSPEPACNQVAEIDIEDTFQEDPDEIPTIKLDIEEFTQNLQTYMQNNMELQEGEMSKALVALTEEAASIPMPKLKNVSRLRTEHHVYELPDSHPLLQGLDRREPDDPCSYLLAIWTPGETANSIQPPESTCNMQEQGKFCDETTCFSCNSIREANSQIVRGTLLIPCRTAMRGSFPLNGTYFQVNEVFADHDSSLNPIDVPRSWIWNLPRRTVYFGTSIPTIFKGLTTEGIQHCFWRGYVCVRGFDQKTRAPRPLLARLHFPVSKLKQTKRYNQDE